MNYKEIEPEYLDFIKKQKYGTPIAFAKTSLKQEWEAYFAGHEKFQAYCVFGGEACPTNICCWTCLFPCAIHSCLTKSKATKASEDAEYRLHTRYVLFPTMIVALNKKRIAGEDAVTSAGVLKFLDYPYLTHEVVTNVDSTLA